MQEQIQWVKISPISILGPHQYAVLETDCKLQTLLGVVDYGEKNVNWQRNGKFIKGANLTFGAQFWCKSQISGFRRVHKYVNGDRGTQAWDPGINFKNQYLRILIASLKSLKSLTQFIWDSRGRINSKLGWRFKKEWKHKPP